MELTITKVPDGIIHGKHDVASSTSGSKHSVEVLFAIKLTKFCEAGSIKFNFAHLTFETIFMKGAISDPEYDLVVYRGPTLGTLRHPVAVRPYSGPCLTILSCVSPRWPSGPGPWLPPLTRRMDQSQASAIHWRHTIGPWCLCLTWGLYLTIDIINHSLYTAFYSQPVVCFQLLTIYTR